jgi:hypothetical protein
MRAEVKEVRIVSEMNTEGEIWARRAKCAIKPIFSVAKPMKMALSVTKILKMFSFLYSSLDSTGFS